MTLEEAIIHVEEVAELHENRCKFYTEHNMPECKPPSMKCAAEHRQLAEWLKELKERREKDAPDTNVGDMISRRAAIDYCYALINAENPSDPSDEWNYSQERINQTEVILHHLEFMPSAQPEQLTDKEQRIFLAAMGREEKVCEQVDDEYRNCREPYEDSLVRTCHEIIRKVKGALWT